MKKNIIISILVFILLLSNFNFGHAKSLSDMPLLKDKYEQLSPSDVFKNFSALNQIPRPSDKEEKVGKFLIDFGKKLGLESFSDETGNVIIRKPASKGMEEKKGVILQAHMDMVPNKLSEKKFDFEKDAIQACIDGDWIKAQGTTLGADDGSGVAMIMSVLESKDIIHGPIEALFTVGEETTMKGANGLKGGVLKGDVLINIDASNEKELIIGCAGGVNIIVKGNYKENNTPNGFSTYEVNIGGLTGGHSGIDINAGRSHANLILINMLKEIESTGAKIVSMEGGKIHNAIPTESKLIISIPQDKEGKLTSFIKDYELKLKKEYIKTDPKLFVKISKIQTANTYIDEKFQSEISEALQKTQIGVVRMSEKIPGLVETSNSMGILKIVNGVIFINCYLRSSAESQLDEISQKIKKLYENFTKTSLENRYVGWDPNPKSKIVNLIKTDYVKLNGSEPEIKAIHAGLECGVIKTKYPNLDMISIGVTIIDEHTPQERLQISSVGRVKALLLETLKNID